jgi:opacity protein-like surface antigen
MKKLVVVAAIFASVLAINSHSLIAQTADLSVKADQELANENAALRKQIQRLELQNAELRSRIHATEKKPVVASTNADGTGRGIPATSALAADLPRKSPPHLPVAAPVYSWTGFYIGGNAGYDWSNSKVDSVASGQAIAIDPFGFGARLASEIASGLNQSIKADPNGFIGSGQVGYNWQFAPQWIVGIEADISGASIKGSDSKASGFGGTGFPFVSQIGFRGQRPFRRRKRSIGWARYVAGLVSHQLIVCWYTELVALLMVT